MKQYRTPGGGDLRLSPQFCLRPHLWPQLSDRHGLEEQQDRQPARERDLQLHEGALPLLQGEGSDPGWGMLGTPPLLLTLLGPSVSSAFHTPQFCHAQ